MNYKYLYAIMIKYEKQIQKFKIFFRINNLIREYDIF